DPLPAGALMTAGNASNSSRPTPRDDLRDLAGYHSPQVDVDVRLNTNESPYPPPPAFVERWLDAMREVGLHRYPDRSATELRGAHRGHRAFDRVRVLTEQPDRNCGGARNDRAARCECRGARRVARGRRGVRRVRPVERDRSRRRVPRARRRADIFEGVVDGRG